MKNLLVYALLFSFIALCGADPAALNKEGAEAIRKKDFATALAKYDAAIKASTNGAQRYAALMGKYQAMRGLKQWKESEAMLLDAVENDQTLNPIHIRRILNLVAGYNLWNGRHDFAISLLKQAHNLPAPKVSNDYFRTCYYLATLYANRKNQPQMALEIITPIAEPKGTHPSNSFQAFMLIGSIHEKAGRKAEALQAYKRALAHGSRITYKYDLSPAKKAIERLSK